MALPTVIAENQTTFAVDLEDLDLTVPASGSLTLTDFSRFFECAASLSLNAAILAGDILINDGTTTLTLAESLAYLDTTGNMNGPVTGVTANALVKLSDTTGRYTESTGITVDTSGNMNLGSGNLTTSGIVNGNLQPGTFTFPSASNPNPTTLGEAVFNTDDDHIRIGDGSSYLTLIDDGTTLGGDLSGTLPNAQVIDLTIASEQKGALLYNDGSGWEALAPGSAGEVLTTGGVGVNPSWSALTTGPLVTEFFYLAGPSEIDTDAWTDVPSASTTITTSSEAKIWAIASMSCTTDATATGDNFELRLVIDSENGNPSSHQPYNDLERTVVCQHETASAKTAGTYTVKLQARRIEATGDSLFVEDLGIFILSLAGPRGEKGDPGTGSTIAVEDEGTPLGSSFDTLDFTGDGVTASDAGGGTATINIPGFEPNIFQARRATDFTIGTSATAIPLDAEDFKDSNYTHSTTTNPERVTFNVAGVYKVYYNINFDTDSNFRRNLETACFLNGASEIIPSRGADYARNNTDDRGAASAQFYVSVAQNDYIELYGQNTGSGSSLEALGNLTWLMIEFVRAT